MHFSTLVPDGLPFWLESSKVELLKTDWPKELELPGFRLLSHTPGRAVSVEQRTYYTKARAKVFARWSQRIFMRMKM